MKHFELKTLLAGTLAAVAVSSLPLLAADPIETPWNQVCRVANGRELVLTTANGGTVQGYCISIDVNGIGVRTKDGQVSRIARTALARLEMRRSKGRQLSSLRKEMHDGLKFGFDSLLSPLAPVGLVVVPGTLVWGAVATPFCFLGDLKYKATGKQEIKLT
jgi:hypothetical protein